MSRVHKRYDDDNLCKIDEKIAFSEPVELPDLIRDIPLDISGYLLCAVEISVGGNGFYIQE